MVSGGPAGAEAGRAGGEDGIGQRASVKLYYQYNDKTGNWCYSGYS